MAWAARGTALLASNIRVRPIVSHRRSGVVLVIVAWGLGGCRGAVAPTTYVRQDRTMPPNTVLFSTMMSDLSAQPGFNDQLMAALAKESKTGAAIMSPKLVHG